MARVSASIGRAPTADDAVLGALPGVVREPGTVAEAAEVVGEATRSGKSLIFVGGGTDLDLGARPERLDVVLRTGRLDRILEHAPSDQIVVAEAGVTLENLARVLAIHGQRLALDPPLSERVTIGGAIAANAFGPRRARYGSVRDLIVGVTLVRSDGRLARGGGKVVKNVAGFDLPKLLVGSLGTLGLIATATFRLHPLPETAVTVLVADLPAARLAALAARVREAQLDPAAVAALWRAGDRFDLAVCFEGFGRGVAEQRDRFSEIARGEPGTDGGPLEAAEAVNFWARHDALRTGGSFRAKVAAPPSAFGRMMGETFAPLLSILARPAAVWYPTLGLGFITGTTGPVEELASAVSAGRARLAASGGSLVLHAAPDTFRRRVDVWGPPPPALGLMKSVKSRLDPARVFAPGRFVGGI